MIKKAPDVAMEIANTEQIISQNKENIMVKNADIPMSDVAMSPVNRFKIRPIVMR